MTLYEILPYLADEILYEEFTRLAETRLAQNILNYIKLGLSSLT